MPMTVNDFAYCMNKPVMVQFKGLFIIPDDNGGVEVTTYNEKDEKNVTLYGSPMFKIQQQEPDNPTPCLSGILQRHPMSENRLMLRSRVLRGGHPVTLEVSCDPGDIAFVTMIPEHTPKSRLVT